MFHYKELVIRNKFQLGFALIEFKKWLWVFLVSLFVADIFKKRLWLIEWLLVRWLLI
jgi:hypothetical protein